mmetsp:Transcript_10856/g.22995  ORF Transcript_10856/g.22995 Transcript_10856/m.22995 type:complete len:333 (+) Transcript_10856:514-1512(+)
MDQGKDGSGKNGTLGFGLFAGASIGGGNVRVSECSLNERNGHHPFDALLVRLDIGTLSGRELSGTKSKVTENFEVDVGGSFRARGERSTGFEVLATLVGKGVEKLSAVRTIDSLEASGVECHGFVPGVNGVFVASGGLATVLAIVEGVFHLSDDVHPDTHVSGCLFDGLGSALESVSDEISISIRQCGGATIEGGLDPLVGVIEVTVVFPEFTVGVVGAVFATVHLCFGVGAELLDGSLVRVGGCWVVCVLHLRAINAQRSGGSEASRRVLLWESANLTSDVRLLVVGGLVLDTDGGGSVGVVFVYLSINGSPVVVFPADGGCLLQTRGEGR